MSSPKVSLKLFISKKRQRVLYAEADKEFVDFLFSIFTMPVGAVTKVTREAGGMVGSFPNLYRSIENLSVTYIQPDTNKHFLLEPKVVTPGAKVPLLLPNGRSTICQLHLYRCSQQTSNNCRSYVADTYSTICPSCKSRMRWEVTLIASSSSEAAGYVKPMVTYMVMDDMEVKAMSTNSLVTLLSQLNVKEIGDIEEKVVDVGMGEGVKLLKASLQSKTVLTDVFLSAEIIKTEEPIKN